MRTGIAKWIALKEAVIPVKRADVLAADLARPFRPRVPVIVSGQPITINWVTTPPRPGSGGHTTLFRLIRYLEMHGYRNRIYFYDVYGGDHAYYEAIVRQYYGFHNEVGRVENGMEDAHAVVATSWPTAYPVFNSRCAGKRFYFIQDFEPDFHPAGSLRSLAESTYRMGFHGISIGQCFAERLRTEFHMTVDTFDYGCDTGQYRRLEACHRSGVVFYARRGTARRGCELGLMALEVFAARRPEIEIHIYGDRLGKLPFAFINHGHVGPGELNAIYNRCYAGLSLSFSNVSLVVNEMLAAGCIPIVNDSKDVRMDLKSPVVRYAEPFPEALASALEAVVLTPNFDSLSRAAAASVRLSSWDSAGSTVDRILQEVLAVSNTRAKAELLTAPEHHCTDALRFVGGAT